MDRMDRGLQRVAQLVRSMKLFSYPDEEKPAMVPMNECIETTLEVAKNEYKHLADVELSLQLRQPIWGYRGQLNQVILNLIVNAAQAIKCW